ncbi:hypothetical protein LEMLEM_LOCUS6765 [Lemmus lemmus]
MEIENTILSETTQTQKDEYESSSGDGDRDRDPHQNNRLSSQGPVERQKEGEDEQGEPPSGDGWR